MHPNNLLVVGGLLFYVFESTAINNINVLDFNKRYTAYMSYSAPAHTKPVLNLIEQNGNIGIHINPRYKDEGPCDGRSVLVLNNFFSGRWQKEIRPSGFPFLFNKRTSVVIVPQNSYYRIFFDFGSLSRAFTFPYRNGHHPTRVSRVQGGWGRYCSKTAKATVYELSVGYIVQSLTQRSVIYVYATSPSTGTFTIDISMGPPQQRDDVPVSLRIKATFGTSPQMYLQDKAQGASFQTRKTLTNPISRGKKFTVSISVNRLGYMLSVNGRCLLTYPAQASTCNSRPATVWISGVPTIEKITAY